MCILFLKRETFLHKKAEVHGVISEEANNNNSSTDEKNQNESNIQID
jgi:hypothetical protein